MPAGHLHRRLMGAPSDHYALVIAYGGTHFWPLDDSDNWTTSPDSVRGGKTAVWYDSIFNSTDEYTQQAAFMSNSQVNGSTSFHTSETNAIELDLTAGDVPSYDNSFEMWWSPRTGIVRGSATAAFLAGTTIIVYFGVGGLGPGTQGRIQIGFPLVSDPGDRCALFAEVDTSSVDDVRYYWPNTWNIDEANHLVVTQKDNGATYTRKFWVNGVNWTPGFGSETGGNVLKFLTVNNGGVQKAIYIKQGTAGLNNKAWVSSVAFYPGVVLSEAQIKALYRAGKG